MRCRSCGTAALEGAPAVDGSLYREGTYASPPRLLDELLGPIRRAVDRERLAYLRGLSPGASVFEIGAGDGRFVRAAERAGFRARGIDPAAGRSPLVEPATAEDFEFAPESQDAIVLWHVLEHLDDPAKALRRAHTGLVAGGRLVVGVPNLDSLQARVGGNRWFHQDLPRHRVQFTPRGLARLLERCAFRVERVRYFVLEQNLLGMWQTLLNFVTSQPNAAFRALKRDLPLRSPGSWLDLGVSVVAGSVLVPAALGLEAVASGLRQGGSIGVEASRA